MTQPAPFVSVVTPFYNTAAYLEECIRSVLSQDFENFEYILVNNCSTDGSEEIAARYARADRRIRLLHTSRFLSQLENYNHAMRQISPESKYCKIVQADDWIVPHCISRMVEIAERHPTVGIVGSYHFDGPRLRAVGLPYPESRFSGQEICRRHLLDDKYYFGTPTVVLFRAEIVRSRPDFFPPGRIYFDTDVCYELSSAWDFGFVHEVLTFLRVDDASITGRALPYNPWLLCKLLLVRTYGQRHLGAAEYRKCLRAISGQYYRYLGQAVLRRRGAPFWEYHARGLATIGERLSAGSLALHAGRALLQLALHPVESGKGLRAERLLRRRNR